MQGNHWNNPQSVKGKRKAANVAVNKAINGNIMACNYFKDFLPIMQQDKLEKFNEVNISTAFSRWSWLWKQNKAALQNPYIQWQEKEEWQEEHTLMQSHLNGESRESFQRLAAKAQRELNSLTPRCFANIANALTGFYPDLPQEGRALLLEIAQKVFSEGFSKDWKPQELANLASAMAKVSPENVEVQNLLIKIATHVLTTNLEDYEPQGLANLASAVAKVSPENAEAQSLVVKIAKHVLTTNLEDYKPQELANLASAMAKVSPENAEVQNLVVKIAKHVPTTHSEGYNPQDLANLANAMARVSPENAEAQSLVVKIAKHVLTTNLEDYNPQDLANLANAVARVSPENAEARNLVVKIAKHVLTTNLEIYKPQGLANLANAVARVSPENAEARNLVVKIAKHVLTTNLEIYKPQGLANLANAVARVSPENAEARNLVVKIAKHVLTTNLEIYKSQGLANLLHGFSKLRISAPDASRKLSEMLVKIDVQELHPHELSQVYQSILYAQDNQISLAFDEEYLQALETRINEQPKPQSSQLQQAVFNSLGSFLSKKQVFHKLELEYPQVGSHIDIALFSSNLKIAIEIDGPTHLTAGKSCNDQFKEALLKNRGWEVLRISLTQLEEKKLPADFLAPLHNLLLEKIQQSLQKQYFPSATLGQDEGFLEEPGSQASASISFKPKPPQPLLFSRQTNTAKSQQLSHSHHAVREKEFYNKFKGGRGA